MMLKHLSTCSCHSNCARWSCCWTLLDGEHLVCRLVAIRWILGLKLMRMVVLWVSLIIWFIGLWPMQLWRMILETNYCQSQFRSGLEAGLGLAYYCTCGLSLCRLVEKE